MMSKNKKIECLSKKIPTLTKDQNTSRSEKEPNTPWSRTAFDLKALKLTPTRREL